MSQWGNRKFRKFSFNSFYLKTIKYKEVVKLVPVVEEELAPDESPTPEPTLAPDESPTPEPPPVIYERHIEIVPTYTNLGYVIVHINASADDYKYENNANKLILTSDNNQYTITNYDALVFFGLSKKEKKQEAITGIKITPSARLQSDSVSMVKSCIRREIMGGDLLDRPSSLLCKILK